MAVRWPPVRGPVDAIKRLFQLGIVDLDPVTVRILKIHLLHAVYPGGHFIFFTGPVVVFDLLFHQVGNKIVNGGYAKTQMIILVSLDVGVSALDEVK